MILRRFTFLLLLCSCTVSLAEPSSQQTLTELLTAEFAIYRGQTNTAQEIYLAQAQAQPQQTLLAERASKLALHNKNYQELLLAAKLWQQASSSPEAKLYLARAYSLNQQADKALPLLLELVDSNEKTDFVLWAKTLTKTASQQGNYQQQLEQARRKHSKQLDLIIASALIHLKAEQAEAAIQTIEKALQLDDSEHTFEYALSVYLQLEQNDKAMQLLQQRISKQPQQARWQHSLLQIAQQAGDEELQQQLEFLLNIEPDNKRYLISLASLLLQKNAFETAEQLLLQALQYDAEYSPAHLYLGLLYFQQTQFDDARAHLLAVDHPDDYWLAQAYLAHLHIEQNATQQAWRIVRHYFEQHELEQSDERWIALKARVIAKQGDYQRAIELYKHALKTHNNSIELYYSRALLAEQHNDLKQSESDLRHIIATQPDHAIAINALGYILADRTDRYSEALALIEQALALQPKDAATLDSMGWVLYKLKKNKQALSYLQQAYELLPDAEIAAHYAEVLHNTGQKKQAAAILRRALKQMPNHTLLEKTVKRLEIDL